jgi:putative PIN family toxin of toxin-antitoxin system
MLSRQWHRSAKKPSVVLDTNVLVSGLISPTGSPAKLLRYLTDHSYSLCVSQPIFTEYRATIARFDHLSKSKRTKFLGRIRQHALWFSPTQVIEAIQKDPSDNKFLECAIEAHCDFILSGDKHLLHLEIFQGIPILLVTDFLEIMGWAS